MPDEPVAQPVPSETAPAPTVSNPSWYDQGYELKVPKKTFNVGRKRFGLKANEVAEITFLDDATMRIYEHDISFDKQNWGNVMTCTMNKWGHCDVCSVLEPLLNPKGDEQIAKAKAFKAKFPAFRAQHYYAGFCTVIDHREFEWNGKQYKDMPVLLCVKATQYETMQNLVKLDGPFAGWTVRMMRSSSDKAPRIGDNWTRIRKADLTQFKDREGRAVKPFDMGELLKPKTRAEVEQVFVDAIQGATVPDPQAAAVPF